MKQFIATFLMIVFTFNSIGCYLILSIQKYEVRREMLEHIKSNLPDSELTSIEITFQNKNDIHWKEANEFDYKGIRYDLVKTEKSNGHIIYHCIADHKEMELLQQFERQINKEKSTKNAKNNSVNTIYKIIPKSETDFENGVAKIQIHKNRISTEIFSLYDSLKLDGINPPPKFI